MKPGGKKPGADFSILIGAGPPKKKPGAAPAHDEPDDDDFDDDEGEDDLAASGDGSGDGSDGNGPDDAVDPEQAHLAKQLGFSEPDQQRALISLIQLVSGSGMPGASSSGGASDMSSTTLPESGY